MPFELQPAVARLKASLDRYERQLHRRISPIDGLTRREFDLLLTVGRATRLGRSGLRAGEIVDELDITPPSITPLINGLEKHGLVERKPDPVDRRATIIAPTARGWQELHRAFAFHVEVLTSVVDELGQDSEVLASLLDRTVDQLLKVRQRQIAEGVFPLKRSIETLAAKGAT